MLLKGKLDGTGWFAHEVLRRWAQNHPQVEFLFLFDRPFDRSFIFGPNVKGWVVPPPARHPWLWHLWTQYTLPWAIRNCGADAFVSPDGFMPPGLKWPTLGVIHDLNFLHYPNLLPPRVQRYYSTQYPLFAQRATQLATVSNFSQQHIAELTGRPLGDIDVVYNGVRSEFFQAKPKPAEPYFVFVGSLLPRKNIDGLLLAHARYLEQGGTWKLLVVGPRLHWTAEMQWALDQHRKPELVQWIQHLDGPELSQTVAEARALVLPSHFEGFGIPLAEAMAAGTPVIAGNNSSMPEVVGPGGLLVDSHNPEHLAQAMLTLENNPQLAQAYGQAGRIHAQQFNWDQTAVGLWNSLQKAIQRHGNA
jgi:glycosyltransferase involved in cell wall biosynthesis